MKYDLYQINFGDDEVDKINSQDPEYTAIYRAYLDSMFGKHEQALEMGLYEKVAEIEAANLEDVFKIGNIGPENKITRLERMHSVSVGDIIVQGDEAHVVASCGFDKIEKEKLVE
jgi:hypothetical protein